MSPTNRERLAANVARWIADSKLTGPIAGWKYLRTRAAWVEDNMRLLGTPEAPPNIEGLTVDDLRAAHDALVKAQGKLRSP